MGVRMTKTAFIASLLALPGLTLPGLALAGAGQATAGELTASGPNKAGPHDPCLLGNRADMAACTGMIRIVPGINVHSQSSTSPSKQGTDPAPWYNPAAPAPEAQPAHSHTKAAASAPGQQTITVTSTNTGSASQASSGGQTTIASHGAVTHQRVSMQCVTPEAGATVACRGHWVPAPQVMAHPQSHHPQSQPQPQPHPAPALVLQIPAPHSTHRLPPPVNQTLPTYTLIPPVQCCEQREVILIPASFFVGAMSYGVGFPSTTSYGYGGGYGFVGGSTRFSGVSERTRLVPPPPIHRKPPPRPCGGCH